MGRNSSLFLAILVMTAFWCLTWQSYAAGPGSDDERFHFGLSTSMFYDVKENDVKAASRIWAQALFKEQGLPIHENIILFKDLEEMAAALRNKQVDAIGLNTYEYWVLQKQIGSEKVVVAIYDGDYTEEYLLIVHKDSGIDRLADLRGRKLMFVTNTRMALAPFWLDILLAERGLGTASSFFNIEKPSKPQLAILPVFFHQKDACIVTRRAFQTMIELNPQLGRSLKVIATSPNVVPGGFVFRSDAPQSIRDKTLASFEYVNSSPAYQQALTLFQTQQLKVFPTSILDKSFELLATHSRMGPRGARSQHSTE